MDDSVGSEEMFCVIKNARVPDEDLWQAMCRFNSYIIHDLYGRAMKNRLIEGFHSDCARDDTPNTDSRSQTICYSNST